MPPLFHENRFMIDLEEKAKLFNSSFSKLLIRVNFQQIQVPGFK